MNQVGYFFKNLLGTKDFPARWHCGNWSPFHGWLYIISDLLTWSAYFAIPLIIIRYITKRRNSISFNALYFLFAAFILACGTSHLIDAMIFWVPVYRVSALVGLATGVISWITVFYLIKLLPTAFAMKSPQELQAEVDLRLVVEEELRQTNEELHKQNERLGEIAWTESHKLRGPLATIMGLTRLFNSNDPADPDNAKIIEAIYVVSKDLDAVIKEVVDKASNFK